MPIDERQMEQCAEYCHECQDACLRTMVHCLGLGGMHAGLEHQTTLLDCAVICGASHSLLHRKSPRHVHTCRACAEICFSCADACERMPGADDEMKACAKTCRKCAESCEKMSLHVVR